MIVSIGSWYIAALMRAALHIDALLDLVFAAIYHVGRIVYIALITFFMGTGATRFLLDRR